ncbi:MAG TPA: 30S ribosomal protein S17 [Firmicutes bacterium]|nr:MAG: 30S ribosomal protein S17 [Candidatus Omnitrophota bacterium]HDD64913.1 30S ribosomal protein S17 [Bacillota bacterium]
MEENKKRKRIEKIGVVVSDKMDKTRVVQVETLTQHPLYKKTIRKRKKFMAHDEGNVSKVGDVVKIIQTRPLSRHKRWVIIEILKQAGESKDGTVKNNA